jgi:RNA polymerase sigma-70 factor (ECF subfamily)
MTTETVELPDFDRLAREFSPSLRRFLQRQVGDAATAEDLLQETLLRVARGLESFAGRSSPKTWMFTIASHVAMDHLRQPARRQQIVAIDDAAQIDDGAVALDERLAFDEMNSCVREVIDSLPPDYRTALILHDLEEMDCEQTAKVMGVTIGAAKVRIHRARARLKAALEQTCGFYRDSDSVFRCSRREDESPAAE